MKLSKENRIVAEEISQAVVRILVSSAVLISTLVLTIFFGLAIIVPVIVFFYLLFSIAWWLFVKSRTGDYPLRRTFIALSDLGSITFAMHFAGQWGALYFFTYLWVIVGNGMRFGGRALIESTAIGIVYFIVLISNTQYWINNVHVTIGLLVGLILLPSYYYILIRRLSNVSDQLSEELSKANYAATHDALSGLSNREYYFRRLEDKINEAGRHKEQFIVMYIDLDGFKEINDNWGHSYGDEVIRKTSSRLKAHVRDSDLVARFGGDEFAIILYHIDDVFNVTEFTDRLISKISEPITFEGHSLHVTASIGISNYPSDGESAKELIHSADQSMYLSKKNGKNMFTLGRG